ncbi:MAG TPA: hypothetical protein VHP35_05210 [Terriglobia bacterium]|nr:hypothetical protein [Terriglobia bacterium]
MRPRTLPLLAITVATLLLVLGPVAQAPDNNVGTWKLNLAKSKYIPGPAPFEGTLKIEPETNGLKFTIHGTDAEGKPVDFEFSPRFDGKDYVVTGLPEADTIVLKRINANTIETVTKKGGKPVMTTRSVVSKDGKTRTSTQKGTNAKGERVNNTMVYEKQ